jgi:hypothetical protein
MRPLESSIRVNVLAPLTGLVPDMVGTPEHDRRCGVR